MTAVTIGWRFAIAVPSWLLEGHPAQDDAQLIDARRNGGRFHGLRVAQCAAPLQGLPPELNVLHRAGWCA